MIIAILAAAALAGPSPSLGATDAADGRCIALMNFMVNKGTAEQQAAARTGVFYFVGKIRGRNARADLAAVLKSSAEQATAAKMNAQTEIQRCGAEVSAAAASLRPATPPPAAATPRKP